MAHDQNVLISLTEDEARLLRSILANGLERDTEEAQLFNGTNYGSELIKRIGTLHLVKHRLEKNLFEAKTKRLEREAA